MSDIVHSPSSEDAMIYPSDSASNVDVLSPPGPGPITRTVAIIKNHALEKRFDIEPRITEAQFEIVKERQMEFDTETDPETLYELFGEDANSFNEGPVWVYVLERPHAVSTWLTLIGPSDPSIARETSPSSLRALYGLSKTQNAIMGSPDDATAEIQIASLFASSPPFPSTDLPPHEGEAGDYVSHHHGGGANGGGRYGSMRSVSESVMSALRRQTSSTSNNSHSMTSNNRRPSLAGANSSFKARALPTTHQSPDIAPRMTKAAALRAGLKLVDPTKGKPKVIPTKEEQKRTFMDVPGHKRSETIAVASTNKPAIAPRMTKAAALRLGIKPEELRTRSSGGGGGTLGAGGSYKPNGNGNGVHQGKKDTFEGVPGHKRRETIAVASIVREPSVAPRLNKSAALRAARDNAPPPSSFMFKGSSTPRPTPGLSRSNSTSSLGGGRPGAGSSRPGSSAGGGAPQRPSSAASSHTAVSRYAVGPRPSSSVSRATGGGLLNGSRTPTANGHSTPKPTTASASAVSDTEGPAPPGKPSLVRRPSSISAPSIAPRMNKSAALRAEKKALEEAEAAKKAAKLARRTSSVGAAGGRRIVT